MVAAVTCRMAPMKAFAALVVALMRVLVVVAVGLVMVPALPPVAQDSYHNAHRIEPKHLVVSHMKNKICNPIRPFLPLCILINKRISNFGHQYVSSKIIPN